MAPNNGNTGNNPGNTPGMIPPQDQSTWITPGSQQPQQPQQPQQNMNGVNQNPNANNPNNTSPNAGNPSQNPYSATTNGMQHGITPGQVVPNSSSRP
jgi:hypothetical protein